MISSCAENCLVSDFMWHKIDSGGYYKTFGNVHCLLPESLSDIIPNYGDVCTLLLLRFGRSLTKTSSKVWQGKVLATKYHPDGWSNMHPNHPVNLILVNSSWACR